MDIIVTHEHADFDALASLLAAAKLHPGAVAVLPRQMNRNLQEFLALYRDEFPFVAPADLPRQRVDRVIVVDTQTFAPPRRIPADVPVQIIDHHPLARSLETGWSYWGEPTGATTTLLVEQICNQHIALSPIEATLLLLGIYEDTGSLGYSMTTPRDVRCAAWLLEQGASLAVVNNYLHHPLSDEQRALYQQLVDNSQPYEFAGQAVIISSAHAPDYGDEISTLAHKLRDLFEPAALFLLVDLGDRVQLVARSSTDAIDVGAIAGALGGGGHPRAAAALLRGPTLAEAKEKLIRLLKEHAKPPVTVSQIMSYGVQTLSPDTTVADAYTRMRRYGHEGFPVVEDGRIVGMVTRREIDRALQHGLDSTPIRRYMAQGEVFVRPHDPVAKLQTIMTEQGWGQVPVVGDDGEILGIVTRTDLIKLWSGAARQRPSDVAHKLEAALPKPLLDLLRQASHAAGEMGYPLYVVGGFVRDLLLGTPTLDLDLVVEGDAIALAKKLAAEHGGRVRSHRRFGTAKWIINGEPEEAPAEQKPVNSLPRALDFVTARTEFYEHPTALPTVEQGSIKLDLHRRDFTINTLAIRLDADHWGELLDFYGGRRDLEQGIIRVLHSLSFVEDPTRILRAARLEARLNFRMEERTEQLVADALDLLDRVSGERIRHELYLTLAEGEPERALARLDELGVLRRLHPSLVCNGWVRERFSALRETLATPEPGTDHPAPESPWPNGSRLRPALRAMYLALLTYRLDPSALATLLTRLRIMREDQKVVAEVQTLRSREMALADNNLSPSRIYRLLADVSDPALLAFYIATDSWLVQQRIGQYRRHLRHVRPLLDGAALRRMGIPPGPAYRRLLDALRDARLDGIVSTLAEEEALLQRLLTAEENRVNQRA